MASTRPRRSVKAANYKEMLESDSEGADAGSSDSGLSEDSDVECSIMTDQHLLAGAEVVHRPTASEILETERLIRTTTAELVVIESKYEVVKQKFQAIEAKRNAMRRQLLESKAYLAPIRALPQEILGIVFLCYTEAYLQNPWILMQVTRTWRAAALSTRAIWAKIMLTSPAWKKHGATRRMDGREVCGSVQQLDRALRRAGNAPLDITFALTNPAGGGRGRQYDRAAFHEMASHLASSRKCLQVHHIEIKGLSTYSLNWTSYWRPLGFPESLDFPALKTLRYRSSVNTQFLQGISQTAKQVTEVELTLSHSTTPYGFEDFLKSPRMLSLSLDAGCYQHYGGYTNVEKLRCALDNASFITNLELTSLTLHGFDPTQAVLRCPHLHTLILNLGSKSWAFDAPSLTNLTLTGSSFLPPGPPGSNNFPLLASLTIREPNPRISSPDYLGYLQLPPLHTLDLCLGTQVNHLRMLVAHQADLNPVVFRLRRTTLPTTTLTQIVDAMDRLEELHLEGVPVNKNFFEFLGLCRTDALIPDDTTFHCPLLLKLQVDLKDATPAQKKPIKPAAKKAVDARFKASTPMESWTIRYSEERGWVDLLM